MNAAETGKPGSEQSQHFVPIDLSKYDLRHHLLHASLSGPNRLEEYSLALGAGSRLRAVARFGEEACGHPHIVHGGAIASLLDDSFGTLFLSSG
jgi:acyl-coenzyme A thioesterase PaaI-like protein